MTILPIVERELRVAARRAGTYWFRSGLVLAGLGVSLPGLAWAQPFGGAAVGRGIFTALVGAGFLLSCAACLLSADVISSERREGTLGLLLLTRVRSFDLVLGKMASAGWSATCGLVACLPLLVIPILAGGVSGGEAFRKGLVLLDTVFVALAAGIWASVRGKEWSRAGRSAVVMVAYLVLVPGLFEMGLVAGAWGIWGSIIFLGYWGIDRWCGKWRHVAVGIVMVSLFLFFPFLALALAAFANGGTKLQLGFELLSPLVALINATDLRYVASPGRFWSSLVVLQGVGWMLLWRAGIRLRSEGKRQSGMVGGAPPTGSVILNPDYTADEILAPGMLEGGTTASEPVVMMVRSPKDWRGLPRPGDGMRYYESPMEWWAVNQPRNGWILLGATIAGFIQYLAFGFIAQYVGGGFYGGRMLMTAPIAFFLAAIQGSLFAWVASRYFVEARKSGELEFLLTTPEGAKALVSEQWRRLKRNLRWPLVLIISPALLQCLVLPLMENWMLISLALNVGLRAAETILGILALCKLAFWFGLNGRGQSGAILWSVGFAKAIPFGVALVAQLILTSLRGYGGSQSVVTWVLWYLPHAIILWYYIGVMRWAGRRMAGRPG